VRILVVCGTVFVFVDVLFENALPLVSCWVLANLLFLLDAGGWVGIMFVFFSWHSVVAGIF
jgi:hypothetical protein